MLSKPIVLVPADRVTDIDLLTKVAMVAVPEAEIHILDVTPRARTWSASPETTHPSKEDGAIRHVRLRGRHERVISRYAELIGARAIVVDRHYGASPLWRGTSVVARLGRLSSVPVLAVPSGGRALDRWAAGKVERVLAALDSTHASAVALQTSIGLATRHGARLTMLHALDKFPGRLVFSGNEAWRVMERLRARQKQVAERLERLARHLGRSDAAARVITGDAAPGIVSAAFEMDADVIVMGVAPRTWLDRSVFGSTLGGVLRRAPVPVLVLPVVGGEQAWSAITVAPDVMDDVHARFKTTPIAA
jgi:nucleotide-binding universal stress UspA family protein